MQSPVNRSYYRRCCRCHCRCSYHRNRRYYLNHHTRCHQKKGLLCYLHFPFNFIFSLLPFPDIKCSLAGPDAFAPYRGNIGVGSHRGAGRCCLQDQVDFQIFPLTIKYACSEAQGFVTVHNTAPLCKLAFYSHFQARKSDHGFY